ncbi:MAG TPA: hypothetical protein VFW49_10860 [Fluviicoccus sp.]|nr:hypothetical protein [Fluviicoccus sp.]
MENSLEANVQAKAFFIAAYFKDLQDRVLFLQELYAMGRREEALLLCCCYIEALGSRLSADPKAKAKNYCDILMSHGGNDLWHLIYPSQIKSVLSGMPLFKDVLPALSQHINMIGMELICPQDLISLLINILNHDQLKWLRANTFKGSMAYFSYQQIRSELVHDISTAHSLSFGSPQYHGNPIPSIDFPLLYSSLRKIVTSLESISKSSGKWWWEE